MTLENLTDNRDDKPQNRSLTFDATNHDDILEIIEKVRLKGILPDLDVAAFCTGLKLFGEVMMVHRREALFRDLIPAFRDFMLRLKRGKRPDLSDYVSPMTWMTSEDERDSVCLLFA
ncbi:DUF3861 domain-containing protein [Dickeya ananatis]|uniref:DUF3861 domain-containing protein n=1 Tax=Dickeya ananatis TaxID=3061286 RepID=UPI00389065C1